LQVFNAAFAAACIGIEHLNESLHGRNGRMKSILNFLVLLSGLLLANFAPAETPSEQLQQMVGQLQQSPNDNALREKIIRLAPTLKPSPALPDAAVTFEGRAQFAFGSAKSEDDYLAAAREYEKAVAAAPWVPGYYTDLCTIYQKAGKFEDAKRHCGYYLSGLTDPAQITDVKRRIAGLEFGIEKANSPQTAKAAKPAGPDFSGNWGLRGASPYVIEKKGDDWIISNKPDLIFVKAQGRQLWFETDLSGISTRHYEFVLSEDGQTINVALMDTQSPEQSNKMQRLYPGSTISDPGRHTYFTLSRK
jgi:hypothetical protein